MILSNSFSYNKKRILISYRNSIIKKSYLRLKTKYNYFRRGFLRKIRNVFIHYKLLRKKIKLFYFHSLKSIRRTSTLGVNAIIFKPWWVRKRLINVLLNKFLLFRCRLNFTYHSISWSNKCKFRKSKAIFSLLYFKIKPLIKIKANFCMLNRTAKFNTFILQHKITLHPKANFLQINKFRYIVKRKLKIKKQKQFYYSVHIAAPKKKEKKLSLFSLKTAYYKKLSTFFGFKKSTQFKSFYSIISKSSGVNETLVLSFLESRLETLLFRSNFFSSIYFVKKFIKSRNVFVNNTVITHNNYCLILGDIVSINRKYIKFLYSSLKFYIKRGACLLNVPPFIEVDYKLFAIALIKLPNLDEITLPASFKLYTKHLTVDI